MTLSIIIPALNEAPRLRETLAPLRDEIILVDGGSSDDTTAVAAAHGAKVLTSQPGRATQMNLGAAAASGDVLLFLHADTLLPPDYGDHVQRVLDTAGTIAGAFRFRVDRAGMGFRFLEACVDLRCRWRHMPYGDQAIFMAASTFHAVGGYPVQPLAEDYELLRHLRRRGRVTLASADALTSGRRWDNAGLARMTLVNQACICLYRAGVSPSRLARWRGTWSLK